MIKDFTQARDVLAGFMPLPGTLHKAYKLERMRALMNRLGDPQDSYKVIHVAGTSGKTSTSYYLASLLRAAGKEVGLTVSPHIDEVNERVQLNLKPLLEPEFCADLNEFLELVVSTGIKPTYFEVLIAFAFWKFAQAQVDYSVVEVGLGGLLDATNVITRLDKVCIITDIGLDHVDVLGKTLSEIATQKAGIIQSHNPLFAYRAPTEVRDVLRQVAAQKQTTLEEVTLPPSEKLPANLPLFQQRNWYLAYEAYKYLVGRDGLSMLSPHEEITFQFSPALSGQTPPQLTRSTEGTPPSPEQCLTQKSSSDIQEVISSGGLSQEKLLATTRTHIPARMEVLQYKGKTIVLDGAHNRQKMQMLADSLKEKFPAMGIATLLSVVKDYDFRERTNVAPIAALSKRIIVTGFASQQDFPKISAPPDLVAEHLQQQGFKDVDVIEDPKEAFERLLKCPEPVLLVTGSFYLMNHIRPLLFKEAAND